MRYAEVPPEPPLDAVVERFWFLAGTGEAAEAPVLPDGRCELILHLADPFQAPDAGGRWRRQDRSLVSGQITRPLLLMPGTTVEVIGIRLRTAAARAVLPIPLSQLRDCVVPLADVAPRLARELFAAAARATAPADRARALERVLHRRIVGPPSARTAAAVARLASRRVATVAAVADGIGVSTRELERIFLDDVGVGPKLFARLARFRRAVQLLDLGSGGARVAVAAGYYDQAHLIRDFRRFAGVTPARYLRSRAELTTAIAGPDLDLA